MNECRHLLCSTNGPTSNSAEFAQAFSCKQGQKNNPRDKCAVW